MSGIESTDSEERPDQPGKIRTWSHPLLARLLDHAFATGYRVLEEVLVAKLPLRLDLLLIRREAGQLLAARRQDVDLLLPRVGASAGSGLVFGFHRPLRFGRLQSGDGRPPIAPRFCWHQMENWTFNVRNGIAR